MEFFQKFTHFAKDVVYVAAVVVVASLVVNLVVFPLLAIVI